MVKRKRVVAVASLVIALCLTVVAGATYALFTGEAKLSTHLVAGSLDIGLVRESGSKTMLDASTGYLKTDTLGEQDFSGETDENVFGVGLEELAVPGCEYVANLKLTNNGSVAFTYKVYINLTDVTASDLAKQLKVYYKANGESEYAELGYLADLETTGKNVFVSNGVMDKTAGKADSFSVKIVFDNLDGNNAAMEKEVNFDLVVEATQLTSDPTVSTQP